MSASKIPRISVVIPTHNRANLVSRAVDSVLVQDPAPVEVIVVDDASVDQTPSVLGSYGDRIRIVRSERSIERGAARNMGASVARGNLLAFLDSDDTWAPDKLRAQLTTNPTLRPSVTGVAYVDERGLPVRASEFPSDPDLEQVWLHNTVPGSATSILVPAELFWRVGGYPEDRLVQGAEDWLFLARLRAAGTTLHVVHEPLVRVLVHSGNDTGDPARVATCMWSAVTWLERQRLVSGGQIARVRAHTAGVIARRYAACGSWGPMMRWLGKTLRHGEVREFAAALGYAALSAGRGVLRRRGI